MICLSAPIHYFQNLLLANEKPADLDGCTCRERASIRYIQSLCSSKETEGKVVFKSQRGSIAASVMRSLTLPRSVFDGPDKYIEPAVSTKCPFKYIIC